MRDWGEGVCGPGVCIRAHADARIRRPANKRNVPRAKKIARDAAAPRGSGYEGKGERLKRKENGADCCGLATRRGSVGNRFVL